ncbi:MAG: hypothetical protein AAGG50_07200 [Bacteroidota bacterium]
MTLPSGAQLATENTIRDVRSKDIVPRLRLVVGDADEVEEPDV